MESCLGSLGFGCVHDDIIPRIANKSFIISWLEILYNHSVLKVKHLIQKSYCFRLKFCFLFDGISEMKWKTHFENILD